MKSHNSRETINKPRWDWLTIVWLLALFTGMAFYLANTFGWSWD